MKVLVALSSVAAPVLAQDASPLVISNLTEPAACLPDYTCGTDVTCCSKRSYFVTEAVGCVAGGKDACQLCQEIADDIATAVAKEGSCDSLDAAAVCAKAGISGSSLLMPVCTMLVKDGCPMVQSSMDKHLKPDKLCTDAFSLCPGPGKEASFCGCLPDGQCVNPLQHPTPCCSGHWKMNYGSHCGKDYHNLPAPAQCVPAPGPQPTPKPTPPPGNPACSAHTHCVGLGGLCCPHEDGMMLECCKHAELVV